MRDIPIIINKYESRIRLLHLLFEKMILYFSKSILIQMCQKISHVFVNRVIVYIKKKQ